MMFTNMMTHNLMKIYNSKKDLVFLNIAIMDGLNNNGYPNVT